MGWIVETWGVQGVHILVFLVLGRYLVFEYLDPQPFSYHKLAPPAEPSTEKQDNYQHPQLLFKTPQVPSNRDYKPLQRSTLGVQLNPKPGHSFNSDIASTKRVEPLSSYAERLSGWGDRITLRVQSTQIRGIYGFFTRNRSNGFGNILFFGYLDR